MAGLKVFVSSTCVDLDAYRFQIRGLLDRMGYDPIMSDHSEVLYDPSLHTHASCIRDVQSADAVVLLVDSRFGGNAVPDALQLIDFEQALKSSTSVNLLGEKNRISITQAEAIQAANSDIPIFTFVDSKVYADLHVYQANKDSPSLSSIKFPSISKQDTATSIFEFINFLSHRSFNNSIITFQSFSDIEEHLLKQWSLLFQRLLQERRDKVTDSRKSADIVARIDELKSAVLQALPKGRDRDVARAVVKYRRLGDFVNRLGEVFDRSDLFDFAGDLPELFQDLEIKDVIWDSHGDSPYYAVLLLKDGGFVGCFSYSDGEVSDFASEWRQFKNLEDGLKQAVAEAAAYLANDERAFVRHAETLKEYHEHLDSESDAPPTVVRRRIRRLDNPS